MRIVIESAEVATLKADGSPWDGPGGPRLPAGELAAFFALDLTGQLDRLVATGSPPTPPDVFVRVWAIDGDKKEELVLETGDAKSFDPRWRGDPDAEEELGLAPGARLRVRVLDRDVLFDDVIGETVVTLPGRGEGRIVVPPFGQVRSLALRIEW